MLRETAAYLERIEDLREQISSILQTLPHEALNWRPDESSEDHAMNSIAVLATHAAGAEHFWIGEVVGGLPTTRDRTAEFETMVADTAVLQQTLQTVRQQTRTILQTLTQDDLDGTRQARDRVVPTRWALCCTSSTTRRCIWATYKSLPNCGKAARQSIHQDGFNG